MNNTVKENIRSELCDDCLYKLMYNIPKNGIFILNLLNKEKTKNPHTAISENKIIPYIKDMTKFTFQNNINILLATLLVGKNDRIRPYSYYITPTGKRLLYLYIQDNKEDFNKKGAK